MGTIKDIIDIITQLTKNVKDRRFASELNAVLSLILKIQTEQTKLHEANIELREEKLSHREQIHRLENEIKTLQSSTTSGPKDNPICPNCSTLSKPFYMSPLPVNFIQKLSATHSCSKCNFKQMYKPK